MIIDELINQLLQKYEESGYKVKEICLPIEWYEEFQRLTPKELKTEDVVLSEFIEHNAIKIFPNQSRHLLVVVEPFTK